MAIQPSKASVQTSVAWKISVAPMFLGVLAFLFLALVLATGGRVELTAGTISAKAWRRPLAADTPGSGIAAPYTQGNGSSRPTHHLEDGSIDEEP